MGDLEQEAHAVAGLPGGVLSGTVLQFLDDLEGVVYRFVGLPAFEVHHRADAAGVVLETRVVKGMFHGDHSVPVRVSGGIAPVYRFSVL